MNKWKLFKGDILTKFLLSLKLAFDFVYIDTVHYTAGLLINLIEVIIFATPGTIIVFHDIVNCESYI